MKQNEIPKSNTNHDLPHYSKQLLPFLRAPPTVAFPHKFLQKLYLFGFWYSFILKLVYVILKSTFGSEIRFKPFY
jgi:hypothetical protein